jgi:PAS domain S-box-containing protein
MDLESLFNNFITSGTKSSDPVLTGKIKALNSFQLLFMMLAPLLGLYYFFYIEAISLFYVTTIAGLLMIPSIIVLRKTQNVVFVSNYAIFVLWATLFILSWNTGAMTSEGVIRPSWILNMGLILLALFFGGYLWGIIWAALVFLQIAILIYLFRIDYPFPNLIPEQSTQVYTLGTFMFGLLSILAVAFLLERERRKALSREQGKSKALDESERCMGDMLERSPIPTFMLDSQHHVTHWNNACQEMTGILTEDALGKVVWEGFAMDERGTLADILLEDPEFVTERCSRSITPGTETGWYELEMFLPKLRGGARALITVAPVFDSHGGIKGAIQTVQEAKIPPAEESEAADNFSGFVASPIYRVDSRGKITFWNSACEDSFGYSSSQMLGKSPLALLAKQHRPVFKRTIVRIFRGDPLIERQWEYQNRRGEPLYVLAKAYPLQSADGEGKECVIVNSNVTELHLKMKRLEAYAQESREELKTLSEQYNLLRKNIANFLRGKRKINW